MFELYFGAFDIVLYAAAFIAAVMLADGICDAMEANDPRTVSAPIRSTTSTSDLTYAACAPSPQCSVSIAVEPSSADTAVIEITESSSVDTAIPEMAKPSATDTAVTEMTQPVSADQTDQEKPVLRVADVRLYKLHKKSVVPLSALPFSTTY